MNKSNKQAESKPCTIHGVGGSVSITATVPVIFANHIKKLHQKHNVQFISGNRDYSIKEAFVDVTVQGTMENIKSLNDEASSLC